MLASLPPAQPRRRAAGRAAWALGAVLALYAGAQLLVSRGPVEAALRARVEGALRARIPAAELGPEVHVDPLFRVTFGPVTIPGVAPRDPALVRVERVKVRPDLWALVRSGRAVPASIRIYGVAVELPADPGALREAWARLRPRRTRPPRGAAPDDGEGGAADGGATTPPIVRVRDLSVTAAVRGERLTFGPVQLVVRAAPPRDATARRAERVELDLPAGGRGELHLERLPGGWRGDLAVTGLGPGALPAPLLALPVTWTDGALDVRLSGEADADLSRAEATAALEGRGLFLRGAVLADGPVGPLAVKLGGALRWDAAARRATLQQGRLELLGAVVALQAEVRLGAGLPFSASARADAVDHAKVAAALPSALALPEGAPRATGTLDAHVALAGALLAPATWQIDAGLDLSRMREAARQAPPVALRGPFLHRPLPQRGEATAPAPILVGPEDPRFVPVAELPAHVIRAVTTSEDAGFFGHSGFDFDELKLAAVQGAQAGRVVRGGSTISQQLAKNLFLGREKTLARKLREAFLTVALEATLSKQRLLEIYLNVAEWGPGVWGIGPAAQHWFGKDARALTPRQAAFLATVIPNPVRYHYLWIRGEPTEGWSARVNGLLAKMAIQGVISDDTLWASVNEPLTFARAGAGDEAVPAAGGEDDGAAEGMDVQPRRPRARLRAAR